MIALRILPAVAMAFPLMAQMVSPAIDREGQPFSYFSQPTDVIGAMDAQAATEVTPEGYLYTGFGELMFFTGLPPVPIQARIRTLHRGCVPARRRQSPVAATLRCRDRPVP